MSPYSIAPIISPRCLFGVSPEPKTAKKILSVYVATYNPKNRIFLKILSSTNLTTPNNAFDRVFFMLKTNLYLILFWEIRFDSCTLSKFQIKRGFVLLQRPNLNFAWFSSENLSADFLETFHGYPRMHHLSYQVSLVVEKKSLYFWR